MRGLRRALITAGAAMAVSTSVAGAQDLSQRFSISQVQDTTFTFAVGRTGWVKPKQRGVAVDARERDALVARFRVIGVNRGLATAVITGQTTVVTPAHTVIMQRPPERWYRNAGFWAGTVVGLAGGVLAGTQIH